MDDEAVPLPAMRELQDTLLDLSLTLSLLTGLLAIASGLGTSNAAQRVKESVAQVWLLEVSLSTLSSCCVSMLNTLPSLFLRPSSTSSTA